MNENLYAALLAFLLLAACSTMEQSKGRQAVWFDCIHDQAAARVWITKCS